MDNQIQTDLLKINFPPRPWIVPSITKDRTDVLDVAIIGGGMAGIAATFALMREGFTNIHIFDANPQNQEGPWIKHARMKALRSNKRHMGPALGVPSLTFWSWYEAHFGNEEWEKLEYCPTAFWHEYLCWLRKVLKLPIKNKMALTKLNFSENLLELTFNHEVVYARKIVLATGREGSGGFATPNFLNGIAKKLYAHTGEVIDSHSFFNKRIAVIGSGASAFDAAGTALENGATSVEMLVRRPSISKVNKFRQFAYPGLENGFYLLPDAMRCLFFAEVLQYGGSDPSRAAMDRIKHFENLHIHYDTHVQTVAEQAHSALLQTNRGVFEVDFIFVATGYDIDFSKRCEFDTIRQAILLWKNRVPEELLQKVPLLGCFPYLGANFEFMEAEPGAAPFLKNIHCFNYGAFLSHGLLSGDIPGISVGATRLAKGIAADFFLSESQLYFEKIRNWQTPEFDPSDYEQL